MIKPNVGVKLRQRIRCRLGFHLRCWATDKRAVWCGCCDWKRLSDEPMEREYARDIKKALTQTKKNERVRINRPSGKAQLRAIPSEAAEERSGGRLLYRMDRTASPDKWRIPDDKSAGHKGRVGTDPGRTSVVPDPAAVPPVDKG